MNDGYMGSGTYLKRSMKKHGIENFEKIILENFNTAEEMFDRERELVTDEFVKRKDTYNIIGGGHGSIVPFITVRDKDGNCFNVQPDDPRYLSGELTHVAVGKVTVKDKNGKTQSVAIDDPRYLSGELVHIFKGLVAAIDENGNKSIVTKELFNKSDKLYGCTKGSVLVTDGKNNFHIPMDEYSESDYKFIWSGRKHKLESIEKMRTAKSFHQKGIKNSQYGTCWINDGNINKKIKKEELPKWTEDGWHKGRKIKYKKFDKMHDLRIRDFKEIYPCRGWTKKLAKLWKIHPNNVSTFCHKNFPEHFK